MNRLGFLAPNLLEINISRTIADDTTMIELSKTLEHLHAIDISYCPKITVKGLRFFMENRTNLRKFWATGNLESVTDYSIYPLRYCKSIESINIEYCYKVTDESLECLADA
jgi:hypothetical protein